MLLLKPEFGIYNKYYFNWIITQQFYKKTKKSIDDSVI